MTESRRHLPTQKALPLPDWPHADRKTWRAAQATAGVLDDGGVVSHLSPRTLEDLTSRYAYFLSFLSQQGRLETHGPAAASVTEENILLYVRYLEPRVSSVTLAQSLYKIARVAACLAPERDWRWLKRLARRLDLRAKPRDRRNEVVEIWLSASGRPLDENGLYRLVCKRTREAFGKRINPHLFRSCLATSIAIHHGALIGLAMTVLRHQNSTVIQRHYNQAKMIDAVRAYQEMLLGDPQLRRKRQ
jgi:hypothetical protein